MFENIQVHASGDVLKVESIWIPNPQLVLITLDIFFEVALEGWEWCETCSLHGIIVLAAKNKILTGHFLGNMETHLTISLHTNFLWLYRLWPLLWLLIAVENFNIILHIGMKWKWKSALEEGLGEGTTVSIEWWAFDVSLCSSLELRKSNIEALNNVMTAQIENSWITSSLLFRVSVHSTVMHQVTNPVSCDPVALHTLWSSSLFCNVNLDSWEVILRIIIGVVVAIRSIDICWSLTCNLHASLRF